MQNILNELSECLKEDERLVVDGRLVKNKIVELALSLDESLIKLLLKNETIKKHFFRDVDGLLIFDKVDFQKFVSNKQFLPDSYTAFKNKIGLTANGEYLTESKEVVLSWPYKDCVLEGGQTKEDQRRKEIFWNETLAPDEIDRLLSPKVLTNFKRYDKDGEHQVERISLKDNLIIKGNNLFALESLVKVYSGKVKLIYIDPPYNTGEDGFGYNDNFNHSSWLVFMKNRLQASKRLLSDDGCIWISADDNEVHYLKILCDEIFNRDNFIANFIWERRTTRENRRKFSINHDHILLYALNKNAFESTRNALPFTREARERYKNPDNDPRGDWQSVPVIAQAGHATKNQFYEITTPTGKKLNPPAGSCWRFTKERMEEEINNGNIYFTKDGDGVPRKKIFLKDNPGLTPETLWLADEVQTNDKAKKHNVKLSNNNEVFSTPKPEELLRKIVHISTNENELVLDFFVGSGTMASVAHKMQRKYIACEQLDYIDKYTLHRMMKVIEGEQGGISKDVNWQGGGSFIYAELKKANAEFSNQIEGAKSLQELESIWDQMQKTGFISYRINPKTINENISEFEELSLDEQKRFLIELLDKNQLYVNYSEIDDTDFNVSDEDKKLNMEFYNMQ